MHAIIDWTSERARMTILFVLISIIAGWVSYFSLPKEGEPDIEIPAIFISIPAPGISTEDSERLLVKPLETRLSGLTGLEDMIGTASEGYAGISMQFDFNWNRDAIMAEIREEMNQAEAGFPDAVDSYSINEINFSEFPIAVVSITGNVPERTLVKVAKELQDKIEALPSVLSAELTGARDEIVDVTIDSTTLENYDITANDLLSAVTNNNRLVAAGKIENNTGAFPIKIPSSFETPNDVFELPVKVAGDSVITIGDVADIRMTFADRETTARFNGLQTLAIQIVKRKGENAIDTVNAVKTLLADERQNWPQALRSTVNTEITMDTSNDVQGMVAQLEASVITAILLVMLSVLAALGPRSAMLVGFSIPTSFLLTFALLAMFDITISNIVMFALILAVGMLVDSSIVIVEYAVQEEEQGAGPMRAYTQSAKRMAWPVISSTATTLCAFIPLLLWPGLAGQFMGNLPRTIIFVLCSSLVVALIFLPVMGGVVGRLSRKYENWSNRLRVLASHKQIMIAIGVMVFVLYWSLHWLLAGNLLLGFLFIALSTSGMSLVWGALRPSASVEEKPAQKPYSRTRFGKFIYQIVSRWWGFIAVLGSITLLIIGIFIYYTGNNQGVTFFADSEPERLNAYVQARGNLSLEEKDRLVRLVENQILGVEGVNTVFSFAGPGGLNQNTGGGEAPSDTIGTIQVELINWQTRYEWADGTGRGQHIMDNIQAAVNVIPGIKVSLIDLARGPASVKEFNFRIMGDNFEEMNTGIEAFREKMAEIGGIKDIEDTRPLPGIDYQLKIDVTEAGRFNANVASVGAMVQLATRGITIGQMRTDTSDEELDILVRLPEDERLGSTLSILRVRTPSGLVPIANFTSMEPVHALSNITRFDQKRSYTISAAAEEGQNVGELQNQLVEWLNTELPSGLTWEVAGSFADQSESTAFLGKAFAAALGLMIVILLAQFNSLYKSVLVILAVVLSIAGVLLGLSVMGSPFSVIMTGTGVLALAGIIVNNNIILIDCFNEYEQDFDFFEAITRTVESRLRPILLTTGTTILGVTPMMIGLSFDFVNGGFSFDSPTSLWWKPLATAIVWGLGFATTLTLLVTPAFLALRYWLGIGVKNLIARIKTRLNQG